MKLPLGFFDSKMIGDILQRIEDHDRIERFLTAQSIGVLFSVFNLVVFVITSYSIHYTKLYDLSMVLWL